MSRAQPRRHVDKALMKVVGKETWACGKLPDHSKVKQKKDYIKLKGWGLLPKDVYTILTDTAHLLLVTVYSYKDLTHPY